MAETGTKASNGSSGRACTLVPIHTNSIVKLQGDNSNRIYAEEEAVETEAKGTKRKFDQVPIYVVVLMVYPQSREDGQKI
ncbi:hypothetical protein F0562_011749 [Nyssa sinensis]|uniref:Uncharacterized protein n=1 Tax=Nyssa sinensis TaxID=561372 RepID=A0A5J4ZTV7_9ASTE|nr:hypothetical protein F0562_011749 [Nyssa sinensis]